MTVWDAILEIKNQLINVKHDFNMISVKLDGEMEFAFDKELSNPSFNIVFENPQNCNYKNLIISKLFFVEICELNRFKSLDLSLLKLYLPYALLPYYSRKMHRCFAISHFAQTLDGKIASFSGESKWIGNEENLIHAHRMRALCDSILVGSNTLINDNPKLNVRLVKGLDPIKIIVGGEKLNEEKYHALAKSTIMFCEKENSVECATERIVIAKTPDYNTKHILHALYEKGICSVYIEGGSFTTSKFLAQKTIDQVQVHISPQILGSGTSSFSFEDLRSMNQSIKFRDSKFIPVGKDIMFIGYPIY